MPHARTGIVLAVVAGGLALTAAVAPEGADVGAAATAYLRIEGITGGATASGYEGWMEVAAFDWGVSMPGASATGGRSATRPDFSPVTVVKPIDAATPLLAQGAASGRRYPEAELVFFSAGSTTPVGSVKLSDVRISASLASSGEAGAMLETLSLSFGKVEWSYSPINPRTGRPGAEVKAGWDVAANRGL